MWLIIFCWTIKLLSGLTYRGSFRHSLRKLEETTLIFCTYWLQNSAILISSSITVRWSGPEQLLLFELPKNTRNKHPIASFDRQIVTIRESVKHNWARVSFQKRKTLSRREKKMRRRGWAWEGAPTGQKADQSPSAERLEGPARTAWKAAGADSMKGGRCGRRSGRPARSAAGG